MLYLNSQRKPEFDPVCAMHAHLSSRMKKPPGGCPGVVEKPGPEAGPENRIRT